MRPSCTLAIPTSAIFAVLADVECGAHRLQIDARSIVEPSEAREAAVLRRPGGQRTPERTHPSSSLRGHEPDKPVGVHHAGMHSEPGHEHRGKVGCDLRVDS